MLTISFPRSIYDHINQGDKVMKKNKTKSAAFRKSKWRWLCFFIGALSLLVILAGGITGLLSWFANMSVPSVGVIGGADGPTAVYISASPGTDQRSLLAAGILLLMGILGFYKLSHLNK